MDPTRTIANSNGQQFMMIPATTMQNPIPSFVQSSIGNIFYGDKIYDF